MLTMRCINAYHIYLPTTAQDPFTDAKAARRHLAQVFSLSLIIYFLHEMRIRLRGYPIDWTGDA